MACSGGVESLDDTAAARLALFAALHDIGKVNVGFQTQIWRDEDLPAGRRRPGHAGHYNELTPVMRNEDDSTAGWFFENLGWWWGATESWDDCGGETVCTLFVAALSHHGQPSQLEGRLNSNSMLWDRYGSLVPAPLLGRGPTATPGILGNRSDRSPNCRHPSSRTIWSAQARPGRTKA